MSAEGPALFPEKSQQVGRLEGWKAGLYELFYIPDYGILTLFT